MLPWNHATTVELHMIISHSDPIGITGAYDKFNSCNSCEWHQEVNSFCDMLNGSNKD